MKYYKIHLGRGKYIHKPKPKCEKLYQYLKIIKNCGGTTITKLKKIAEYKYNKKLEHRDVESYVMRMYAWKWLKVLPKANLLFAEKSIRHNKPIIYTIEVFKITKKGRKYLKDMEEEFKDVN